MDELKFKVSTGLKSILGQDLITSDNIAILELVKNSYDAHATRVIITFEKDSIIIADNGKVYPVYSPELCQQGYEPL